MINVIRKRITPTKTIESDTIIPVSEEVAAKRLMKKYAMSLVGTVAAMVIVIHFADNIDKNETLEKD